MNLLYVGIGREGTTSRFRADTLGKLLPDWDHHRIDTSASFALQSRLARSLAFRTKRGPAIHAINRQTMAELGQLPSRFDLVWVDKAVFLELDTTQELRSRAVRMVHFTPDSAFFQNRSRHFEASAPLYDLLVTTKSFELDHYRRSFPSSRVFPATQGYDEFLHFPRGEFEDKGDHVVFAGLCEPSRERAVEALIGAGIPVRVAGPGWTRLARRHRNSAVFHDTGGPLEADDYARFLSSGKLGLGLLSKKFPELHTTRTFEIPACGTALVTESNEETASFFSPDEAVFFDRECHLVDAISRALADSDRLRSITDAGRERVRRDGRNYRAILHRILAEAVEP